MNNATTIPSGHRLSEHACRQLCIMYRREGCPIHRPDHPLKPETARTFHSYGLANVKGYYYPTGTLTDYGREVAEWVMARAAGR